MSDYCRFCGANCGEPHSPSCLRVEASARADKRRAQMNADFAQRQLEEAQEAFETRMSESKATNPKDAVGIRKLAFSVLPWRVLTGVALAMMEGAAKYGRHNYRAAGVRASVYFDAVVGRHLTDWWEGVDIDPDSGEHHIDKAIAGLMVLRDSMLQGNFEDDRPPRGNVDMADLNRRAAALLDKHADKAPKHYTIKDLP